MNWFLSTSYNSVLNLNDATYYAVELLLSLTANDLLAYKIPSNNVSGKPHSPKVVQWFH